jgi:hypothetical protein
MTNQTLFDNKDEFLSHLEQLIAKGVSKEKIRTKTPYYLPEVEKLLYSSPGMLRFFTLIGALIGFVAGFALTIYTVLSWPMITGGKPLISIPAFLIIAYTLTILFGSLASFFGFLVLARLPKIRKMIPPSEEHGNKFVITVDNTETS